MNDLFEKYTSIDTYNKIVDYETISEMWDASVEKYHDLDALIYDNIKVTYYELDQLVGKYRTVLKENGISKNDVVGIFLPNSIDFVKAFLSLTTLGVTAVLIPPYLASTSVLGLSIKYSIKALITNSELLKSLSSLSQMNPNVSFLDVSNTSDTYTKGATVSGFDDACVVFTGGTTGASKGALLTHKNVMVGTKYGCLGYVDVFNEKYMLVLPLTHVFGLIRNLTTSLYTGSCLFIVTNTQSMFQDIQVFNPTILVLVPALAEMALKLSQKFKKNMLGPNLKYIICGAAFVPPYLVKEYDKMGIKLFPGYGLTESSNLISGNPASLSKPNSVGLVYPDVTLKFVNDEIYVKGPNIFKEYYKDAESTSSAFDNGWFKTGDLGYLDDEGFLYITGRSKEIIVLPSGENVSPASLENLFLSIEQIQDCLVKETEDGKLELQVLLRDSEVARLGNIDVNEYVRNEINILNNALPTQERISKIVFRDTDFVRSPSMKIVRGKN